MTDEMLFELWDKNIPLNAEKIPLLETKTDVIIQRPDRDYAFLHDCMIIQKDDTLFASSALCEKNLLKQRPATCCLEDQGFSVACTHDRGNRRPVAIECELCY